MFFARSQFWSWGRVIHHAIHTHFKFGDKKFNGTQVTVTHRKLRWRPPPSWFWPEVNFEVKYFLNIMLRIFASNLVMIASTARELRLPSWIQDGGGRHFVFHWKSLLRLRSGFIICYAYPPWIWWWSLQRFKSYSCQPDSNMAAAAIFWEGVKIYGWCWQF